MQQGRMREEGVRLYLKNSSARFDVRGSWGCNNNEVYLVGHKPK